MVKKQSEIVRNTEKPGNFGTHTRSTPSRGTKQKNPMSRPAEEDKTSKHVRAGSAKLVEGA